MVQKVRFRASFLKKKFVLYFIKILLLAVGYSRFVTRKRWSGLIFWRNGTDPPNQAASVGACYLLTTTVWVLVPCARQRCPEVSHPREASSFRMRFSANYSTAFCIRAFGITGVWKATSLKAEVWVDTVSEGGRRFATAWRKEEVDAPRNREEKREARKFINRTRVGTTLLLWFVNRGSRGDLREAHGSWDVPISPNEVGSRKGSERKRSEQGGEVRRPRPPCSNIPLDPS